MTDRDSEPKMSLFKYLRQEVTRGYALEADEERYTTRRQKMYTFMKIPRELEKFMSYGFFHCLDSFLFVFTFLPIRFCLAAIALVVRPILINLKLKRRPYQGRWLYPAEIIDLLKGLLIGCCVYIMSHIDTSVMYHIIKSQSVIKLYLFYNMLEVGDRLFSAFGQDTVDALFWTATEPKNRKRHHIGVIPHFVLTITYVTLHTLLVLLQATTLNVAVNASNKALLTIMMSNNFVELKGSVFKKFDKKNLFQVSCSDVRERFHLFSLLFIVVVQTMKEYSWMEESFWSLAPDCLLVLCAEFLVDWIKHAFITRFNEVSAEVYKDYTIHLAYDLAQTKQNNAFADQCDIVSRRMGFIPLPLGVVMIRVISSAFKADSRGAPVVCLMAYLCLLSLRILGAIVILGKACDLIDQHRAARKPSPNEKSSVNREESSSVTNFKLEDISQDGPRDQFKKRAAVGPSQPSQAQISSKKAMVETSNDLRASSITLDAKIQSMFGAKVQNLNPTETTKTSPSAEEDKLMPITSNYYKDFSNKLNSKPNVSKFGENAADYELKTALDKIDPGYDEIQDRDSTTEIKSHNAHIWSHRRSQLLKARELISDSRRRPLSCTPPSTSTSVDEEDALTSSSTNKAAGDPSGKLPDLIMAQAAGEPDSVAEASAKSSGASSDMKLDSDENELKVKSMSSPDFLRSYRKKESDWPSVDDDDKQDANYENKVSPIAQETSGADMYFFPQRRGSSSTNRRKRYDTDRT